MGKKDEKKGQGTEPKATAKTSKFSADATIKLIVKGNPKRKGTKSHTRFALYTNGQKVSEFLAAGGTRADLSWDVEHKHIEINEKAA